MGSRFGALQFHTGALGFWRCRSFGISHNWSWIWSCRLSFGDFLTVYLGFGAAAELWGFSYS